MTEGDVVQRTLEVVLRDAKGGEKDKKAKADEDGFYVFDDVPPGSYKAVPYGVDDLRHNKAWVSVGISSDTAEFAVESIRRWCMSPPPSIGGSKPGNSPSCSANRCRRCRFGSTKTCPCPSTWK